MTLRYQYHLLVDFRAKMILTYYASPKRQVQTTHLEWLMHNS